MKNIFKYLFKGFKLLIYLFLFSFIAMVLLQRISNNSFAFFNYRLFSVISGSMQPKYNIGDVLICKKVDPTKLKVGDDITYIGKEGSYKDKVITHRIIDINSDSQGNLLFHTKGIANRVEDPVISSSQIYGKIVRKAKSLSFIYKMISTPSGFYLGIFVPLIILIGSEIVSSLIEGFEDKKLKKKGC